MASRTGAVWVALILFPLMALLLGLAVGRLTIPPPQVIGALFKPGIHADAAPVIWHIRLPRALASLCAGAALALAGAVLQGVLRNPLAGPQTIGVSSGAAFGGALAIVLGLSGLALVGVAFVAGLATVLAVLAVARLADGPHRSEPSVLTVVLAGIVLSALATAGTTLLQHAADPERLLPQIVYWLMGSFAAASPADTAVLAGLLLPLGLLLWGYGLRLDLVSGGEDEARALGLNVRLDRLIMLAAVAGLGAGAVAVAGVIGWVGLVVPHAARLIVGAAHRRLIPASALIGAGFLCLIDTLARSLWTVEMPISALTAIIGAPVFLGLMFGLARRGFHA
jgi:iron complex transport system permease protein